jgi:hypothetical protein
VASTTLTPTERREAARALKGKVLRQEVFADDGVDAPSVHSLSESVSHPSAAPFRETKSDSPMPTSTGSSASKIGSSAGSSNMVRYRRRVDPADVVAAIERLERGEPPAAAESLTLRAYFLDWAGRRPPDDPVHLRLAALAPGAALRLRAAEGRLLVVDPSGEPLATLSSAAGAAWTPRLGQVVEVRLREKVLRRREHSGAAWRHLLRVPQWWVPLVDVRVRS